MGLAIRRPYIFCTPYNDTIYQFLRRRKTMIKKILKVLLKIYSIGCILLAPWTFFVRYMQLGTHEEKTENGTIAYNAEYCKKEAFKDMIKNTLLWPYNAVRNLGFVKSLFVELPQWLLSPECKEAMKETTPIITKWYTKREVKKNCK